MFLILTLCSVPWHKLLIIPTSCQCSHPSVWDHHSCVGVSCGSSHFPSSTLISLSFFIVTQVTVHVMWVALAQKSRASLPASLGYVSWTRMFHTFRTKSFSWKSVEKLNELQPVLLWCHMQFVLPAREVKYVSLRYILLFILCFQVKVSVSVVVM